MQQVQTPLSQLAATLSNAERSSPPQQEIPTFQETSQPEPEPTEVTPPKQVSREVAALEITNIITANDSLARNRRSKCTSIPVLTLPSAS